MKFSVSLLALLAFGSHVLAAPVSPRSVISTLNGTVFDLETSVAASVGAIGTNDSALRYFHIS